MAPASCVTFALAFDNLAQRRATHLAILDLNLALGYEAFALRPSPRQRKQNTITFDPSAFTDDHAKTVAHVSQDETDQWVVSVRPELEGAALYVTILHELGHVLGLGHSSPSLRGHVMSRVSFMPRGMATPLRRRRWAVQIATEVARERLRKIA